VFAVYAGVTWSLGGSSCARYGVNALLSIWLSLRVPLITIIALIKHDILVIYKEMLTGEYTTGKLLLFLLIKAGRVFSYVLIYPAS